MHLFRLTRALGALLVVFFIGSASPVTGAVARAKTVRVAAAGDIVCDTRRRRTLIEHALGACQMVATATLVRRGRYDAVLAIGDEQYGGASLKQFQLSYDRSWGAFRAITRPVPGNHEYDTRHAAGYFGYFGQRVGNPERSYYSFDLGAWHLIALDGNCAFVGGCARNSPQDRWLRADLARHPAACTLAYWHQPRFSSGKHHSDADYLTFWQDLYAAGADVVLGGHDHDYERFAPQTPRGAADPKHGIRQFVVGTGGRSLYPFFSDVEPNSEVRDAATYGILELTLRPHGYLWHFLPTASGTFSDRGTAACHAHSGLRS